MAALPTAQAGGILLRTSETAEILSDLGSTTYHELHGRLFQKLIADRKVLATFYTLPPSAAFLAEVAVSMLTTGRTGQSIDWSDPEMVGGLRITDPACGTGALLSAAQQAVYRRHRRAGGDDANIHRRMMEEGLTGIDVMPAAAHLSCAMLSCAHPNVDYRHARIAAAPFGETDVQGVQLGSLELMEHDSIHSLFPFGSGETVGPKGRREANIFVGPMSQDLVIMNPPFTRPTNHKGHGREDMPVPSFAGFGTDAYAQKAMSAKLKKQRFKAAAGNAGLASYFVELGMTKVRPGGVLACVIPFSGVQGHSYSKIRAMLDSKCDDVRIISIAAEREEDTAWSADTGMAEALVIAKRRAADGRSGSSRVHFATFPARPQTSVESKIRARGIDTASKVAQWKDSGIAGAARPRRHRRDLRTGGGPSEAPPRGHPAPRADDPAPGRRTGRPGRPGHHRAHTGTEHPSGSFHAPRGDRSRCGSGDNRVADALEPQRQRGEDTRRETGQRGGPTGRARRRRGKAVDTMGQRSARQPGLPTQLTVPRDVLDAGQVSRRKGLARRRPAEGGMDTGTTAVGQLNPRHDGALDLRHDPATGPVLHHRETVGRLRNARPARTLTRATRAV